MHLLIVNVHFAPDTYGGATIVAEAIAQSLRVRHGVRISAFSAMSRSDLVPYSVMRVETGGITNYMINLPAMRPPEMRDDNAIVSSRLSRLVADIQPDLAHVHCVQDLGAGVMEVLHQADVPTVLSIHDFWWVCERQFMMRSDGRPCAQNPIDVENCRGCVTSIGSARFRSRHLLRLAALADEVTYPSRWAMDLSRGSGLAPSKGVVLPNGVCLPAQGFETLVQARLRRDPRPAFGFLGGPSDAKGWPIVRDAFAGLGRDGYRLLLVDGALHGSWWTGVEIPQVGGEVAVIPRFNQEAADAFYAEIDVLLFLSQCRETFGLSIREAIARGVRVIQTDSGGTVEHPLADPATMLRIGDGPDRLRDLIVQVLDMPDRRLAPVAVDSYADQAEGFWAIAERVLAARARS